MSSVWSQSYIHSQTHILCSTDIDAAHTGKHLITLCSDTHAEKAKAHLKWLSVVLDIMAASQLSLSAGLSSLIPSEPWWLWCLVRYWHHQTFFTLQRTLSYATEQRAKVKWCGLLICQQRINIKCWMYIIYVFFSHLNPAYFANVTDFLGCAHTRRGEVNLLFEHGLAHIGVVYGQASRGNSRAFGVAGLWWCSV